MAACERKLFEATVTPRQSMFDNFIRSARQRFVMVDGVHLPLSEMCLSVMVHCHNLLALQRTENSLATEKEEAARKTALKSRARLVESLKYTARASPPGILRVVAEREPPDADEAIAGEKPADVKGPSRAAKSADPPKKCTASPMAGDLLMLYFAVEGLQRSFGTDFDKQNASWIEILPRLDGTVRRELMTLVAISPLNRLLCSELADEFAEEPSIPHLKTLLEDGRAEVLRSLVLTGLIGKVKPQGIRAAMRSVRRMSGNGNGGRSAGCLGILPRGVEVLVPKMGARNPLLCLPADRSSLRNGKPIRGRSAATAVGFQESGRRGTPPVVDGTVGTEMPPGKRRRGTGFPPLESDPVALAVHRDLFDARTAGLPVDAPRARGCWRPSGCCSAGTATTGSPTDRCRAAWRPDCPASTISANSTLGSRPRCDVLASRIG